MVTGVPDSGGCPMVEDRLDNNALGPYGSADSAFRASHLGLRHVAIPVVLLEIVAGAHLFRLRRESGRRVPPGRGRRSFCLLALGVHRHSRGILRQFIEAGRSRIRNRLRDLCPLQEPVKDLGMSQLLARRRCFPVARRQSVEAPERHQIAHRQAAHFTDGR